jgi:hypothetical protein
MRGHPRNLRGSQPREDSLGGGLGRNRGCRASHRGARQRRCRLEPNGNRLLKSMGHASRARANAAPRQPRCASSCTVVREPKLSRYYFPKPTRPGRETRT